MVKYEDSGSPGWSTSFFMQTTEDAATADPPPRPSVVFSSKDENSNSSLQKLQHQVSRVIKGLSHPPGKSRIYNPEVLTNLKRQWARFQMQSLDHKHLKAPSRIFESMVIVGLPPQCDIQALQKQYFGRKSEGSGKFGSALSGQHHSRVEPDIEPQVLFVYPPDKHLPLKYKDLLSFCFPGGLEVHAVEKAPSMSELNKILIGQFCRNTSNKVTCRSYFVYSILTEERLEWLTMGISDLDLESAEMDFKEENLIENSDGISLEHRANNMLNGPVDTSQLSTSDSIPQEVMDDGCHVEHQMIESNMHSLKKDMNDNAVIPVDPEVEKLLDKRESGAASEISQADCSRVDDFVSNKQLVERCRSNAVLPPLWYQQNESCESSSSFQGFPREDRIFRSDINEAEIEEASFSGQEYYNDHSDILEWAKANNNGSLQIICEYYRLLCPARGSTITFHPLEHLHPLEFHRPDEAVLHIAGSKIDLKSHSLILELPEAQSALMAEEEATALSVWAVACLCGFLRLENVLTVFAGALLEKQIVVVCSNLGILSAMVLSIIPLIRPYQWQSLLMPVLPNDMLEFLDAPVPYIVGVKNKTTEVQSKLTNVILVDAQKNQVRSSTIPQLPRQKELYSSLSPYHAKLVGESYLGRKRPVYQCTGVQVEAAKGFLSVLRSYLDSICSNLRSHTITNVQSNDDKVSLLLKESFIESFPSRDQPFMKLFVDTQLFSVHTDLVLSFFQKE
ncbi:uncharacterized protein LOC114299091 isoform X4 [Camellia sinensis]|uniref:uncharacterized protein LOC114299091 isoform X4 n=1 Tax=Camellia sinensis TaxID=4442 RepID=UPI001035974F|nr:uncharacterized protein LOC114299091 isoform X4 [Camellia sinensis]